MGDLSTTGFPVPVEVVPASTGQCTSKYLMQGPSYPAAEECLAAATYAAAAGTQVVGLAPVEASEVLSGDWQQVIQGMQYPVSSPAVSSVPAAAAAAARRPPFASSELSHASSTLTQSPTAQGLESGCWTTGIQGISPQCFSSSDYAPQSPSFRADNFAEDKRPRSRQDSPRKEESLCSAQTPTNRKRRSNSRSAATSGDKRQKLETKADSENSGNSSLKSGKEKPPEPPKDYIHVRARRGQATDSHSLAERVRREKISERMKFLQDLVPGCSKVTGKAVMLDEIINYVQSLQRQVEFLSMKLAAVNPRLDVNLECLLPKELRAPSMTPSPGAFQQQLQQAQQGVMHQLNSTDVAIPSSSPQAWDGGDLQSIVQMFGSLVNFPAPPPSFVELENSAVNPFTQSKA